MELLIITGLSGAGKSQTVHTLEDIGYFCVDNIPADLLLRFLESCKGPHRNEQFAAVLDLRSDTFAESFLPSVERLVGAGFSVRILFLDAADDVLLRRYKETRRKHPLMQGDDGCISIADALQREREQLASARERADYLIDTSHLSTAQLRERLIALFGGESCAAMIITLLSFGYKHGIPADADLVLDVRCLPNPFYIPSLRPLTGCDTEVYDYVFSFDEANALYDQMQSLIDLSLPLYRREGKSSLVIAFGCTGGQHRSVSFARRLRAALGGRGEQIVLIHRDAKR